jgi:hypothetical protein
VLVGVSVIVGVVVGVSEAVTTGVSVTVGVGVGVGVSDAVTPGVSVTVGVGVALNNGVGVGVGDAVGVKGQISELSKSKNGEKVELKVSSTNQILMVSPGLI